MTDLVQGRTVLLVHPAGVADTDPYGRLLRYVDLPDGTDVGLAQLAGRVARTAYDSTDGYPALQGSRPTGPPTPWSPTSGCYSL